MASSASADTSPEPGPEEGPDPRPGKSKKEPAARGPELERPGWPEKLQAFADRTSAWVATAAKSLTGLWVLVLTWVVVQTAVYRASAISFEGPLDVPKALEDRGFSGPVLLSHLSDKSRSIFARAQKVGAKGGDALFLDGADNPVLADAKVPGTGMSLSQLVDLLLDVVGQSPTKVSGNVTAHGVQLALRLRVGRSAPAVLRGQAGDCGPGCLDDLEPLLEQAGRHVVKKLHPIALVAYLSEVAPEEAEEAIRYCLANGPGDDDAAAYNFWGVLLGRKGDTEGAKAKLESALRLAKKSDLGKDVEAAIHNNKGVALARAGAFDEARKAYGDALAAQPGYARSHFNLGRSFHAENNFAAAVAEYKKATDLDPSLSQAHFNQAAALAHLGKKNEALESYRKAEELTGTKDPALHLNWARTLGESGQPGEALVRVERALEIEPASVEARQLKAYLLDATGRSREALVTMREAERLSSGRDLNVLVGEATLLNQLGDKAGAVEKLSLAAEAAPKGSPERAEIQRRIAALRGKG